MKKFLYLFLVLTIVSCNKGEDRDLTQAEQEIENAKLVGTWLRVENPDNETCSYEFTEDFKVFSSNGIRKGESYIVYRTGILRIGVYDQIRYRFEGEYLFITDLVYIEENSYYKAQTIKYSRNE